MNVAIPGNYVTLQTNPDNSVSFDVTEPPPGIIGLGTEHTTVNPNVTVAAVQNTIAMLTALIQQLGG